MPAVNDAQVQGSAVFLEEERMNRCGAIRQDEGHSTIQAKERREKNANLTHCQYSTRAVQQRSA